MTGVGGTPGTDYVDCPYCTWRYDGNSAKDEAETFDKHLREEHPDERPNGEN